MNASAPSASSGKSSVAESDIETAISHLIEQEVPKRFSKTDIDAERVRSSLVRLTSSSIDGLKGLTSELQELQEFVESEVERVKSEIDSALAGIKIIIDTIAPWKGTPVLVEPSAGASVARSDPAGKQERC